jgi:uncharacterized membrane protein YphA (DoxX/SURF4 family)
MILGLLFRLGLGAVFLLSGGLKVKDPAAFLIDVQAFGIVPAPFDYAVALALPWLEIVVGLGIILKMRLRGAGAWVMVLSLSFIGALVYADRQGINLECGCFGDYFVFPNLESHLLFNGVLFLAGGFIWITSKGVKKS